jgi:hypothetical protein
VGEEDAATVGEPVGGGCAGRSRRPHVGARCGSELWDDMRDLLRSPDCDGELEDDVAASFTPRPWRQ